MGTISSRILHQLRYIYPVRRCRWNVVSSKHILTVYTSNMARPDYPSRAPVFIEVRFANIVYVSFRS
jgi:hypothetical protein